MDDIFERLRKLESQTYNKRYFYYDPNDGSVVSIHNSISDKPYPFIEMSIEELPKDFHLLNLVDFTVIEENGKKELVTKTPGPTRIDNSIKTVYVASREEIENEVNLLIEQDNSNKEFRLSLSDSAKDQYWRQDSSLKFMFFVTLENDPSILYMTFVVSLTDLLEKDHVRVLFGSYDGSRSNLYTIKFFRSYLHAVYDENKIT